MKYFLTILFLVGLCFPVNGQDYIVTWKNDTLQCNFIDKPGREGLRPAGKYQNGHVRLPVVFANDSLRVVEAGEVKAYNRQKHGRDLLCDGFFEAKKIEGKNTEAPGSFKIRTEEPWYFMRRIVTGPYASLYILYLQLGSGSPSIFHFITKAGTDPRFATGVRNKKKVVQLLSDDDIAEDMKKIRYRRSLKGYAEIVDAYNKLKREVVSRQ